MRLRLIAVGTRMPGWVDMAFEDYRRRLRAPWQLTLTELAVARRAEGAAGVERARASEAKAMLALLGARDYVVPLDERGEETSTREFAGWLRGRQDEGQDLTFLIGGPDGLAEVVRERAQRVWSLSRLTLAHGLARVVMIEQLYRAVSVLTGHPYHRE